MTHTILAPAATLIVWTLVMLVWMAVTRGPAIAKLAPDRLKTGARGADLEGIIDERTNWKAHNYEHLLEQPTIFYPIVFILALAGFTATDVALAWIYVALRVAHSVWQATINRQPVRVLLFLLASLLLIALGLRALASVV
ncbi:MAG: MAPEG family protein [Croceibacterium sp.]